MNMLNDFKKGVFFTAFGKYSNFIIQFIITAVLSRILTPSDYGVVAVVNVFLIFFQMLADFGIGPAIIQNKDLSEKDIQNIFSFSAYSSLLLGTIFMLLGKPISYFYSNSIYIKISFYLGIVLIISTLVIVPQNILLKEKKFFKVNITTIIANLVSGIVSIIFAFAGAKYYSLIFGNIARTLLLFIVFFFQSPLKIKYKFELKSLKKIYRFSKNQFAFNFINYFTRNLDNLLIGRFMSVIDLGFYNKAYQLSRYPNQMLTQTITPVILPVMSDHQGNKVVIKKVYLRIISILGNIGIPLSVFLFFSSKDIIFFFFGSQWLGSVEVFSIMTFSIWIQMLNSCSGSIFQAANRTDLLLLGGILSGIGTVSGIIIGIMLGNIEYVAVLVNLSFLFSFLINAYLIMNKTLGYSLKELAKELIKPFTIGIIVFFAFFLLPELPFTSFINLLIKGSIFILVFIIGLIITDQLKSLSKILLKKSPV